MDPHQSSLDGGAAGDSALELSFGGSDPSEYLRDAANDPRAATFGDLIREGDELVGRVRESTESLREKNDQLRASNDRIEWNLSELETALREGSDTGGDSGESNPADEPVQQDQQETNFSQVLQPPQPSTRANRQPTPKPEPERPRQAEQRLEEQPELKPNRDQEVDRNNTSRPSVDWER